MSGPRQSLYLAHRRSASSSEAIPLAAGLVLALALALALVHRPLFAAALVLAVPTAWLVTRPYGGVALGTGLLLTLPYWQTLGAPQVTVLRLASVAAAANFAVTRRFRVQAPDVALFTLAGVIVAGWLIRYDEPHVGRIVSTELTPLGFYLGARSVPSARLPLVMKITAVAGTVGASTVIYEFARGQAVFVDSTKYLWNATSETVFRPGGIFGSPPGAATVLSFVVLFGLASLYYTRGGERRFVAACVAISAAALALTFTRAGLIAVGLAVIAFLWLVRSPVLRPLRVAWFAVLVATLYVGLLPAIESNTTFQEGVVRPGTLSQRQSYWSAALPIAGVSVDNFVVGVGSGALEAPGAGNNAYVPSELATSPGVIENSLHNQYVTTLVENGVVGVAALLLFLLSVSLPALRRARSTASPALGALSVSILAMAVIMAVDTALLHGPSFAMLMLASGLAVTAVGERARVGPRTERSLAHRQPEHPHARPE